MKVKNIYRSIIYQARLGKIIKTIKKDFNYKKYRISAGYLNFELLFWKIANYDIYAIYPIIDNTNTFILEELDNDELYNLYNFILNKNKDIL